VETIPKTFVAKGGLVEIQPAVKFFFTEGDNDYET
jgi:hypothetical protein